MQTIIRHGLMWLLLYVFYTYMMSSYCDDTLLRFTTNAVLVPLFMAAYYLLKYVQIPRLYNKDKLVLFGISVLISSFTFSAIMRLNDILWIDDFLGRTRKLPFFSLGKYLLNTVKFYTPAVALIAWEIHQNRQKNVARMQQLEKDKLATELKYLKAQINPHFLFNTLNNLYSYVLNQSPKAPDMIMQLSGILDYVLYKSQNETVPLVDEVDTISNFLKLEHIRYGDRLSIDYQTKGNLTLPISPLILLSIVENAFKHGVSGDIDHPKISIDILGSTDSISCKVWNTKSKLNGELNDAYKDGIGLSNIKRQLNLVYPKNHQLNIEETKDSFQVSLIIKINV